MILLSQAPARGSPNEAPVLFFEGGCHCRRTDSQYTGGITDATAIERHLYYVLFDLCHQPRVVVLQKKDPPLAVRILAPIALLAIGLLAICHDLTASALRTLYCDTRHRSSSFM